MLPSQPVIVSNVFDKNSYADFQGKFMIELANMLMQCKEFAELSLNDKLLLYQHTKAIFSNIERQYSSIQYFGDSMEDYRVLHDDTRAFDYGLETVETNDTDNEKFVKALPLFIKIRDKFISLITKPMKALKITQFEMVYILFQILWTVESNSELSMEAIKVAEKVSDKIADEIHTYYKCELRVHNYAPRLLKLHQLIDGSKAVESTKAETFIISQVYNIYDFQVSPEHFGVIH
uniref:NR LBD domain-containing protein n=1 Tax=Acrobeloides nanus TaxID=290746 RepID=A0A914BUM4_9BILA